MIDRRYPNLVELSRAPFLASWVACRVCPRAGLAAAWDRRRQAVFFYLGTPQTGVYSFPLKGVNVVSDGDIDDLVNLLNLRKMAAARKERIRQQNEAALKSREDAEFDNYLAERRSTAIDRLNYCRKVAGMGKRYRPSLLVNGLKGAR